MKPRHVNLILGLLLVLGLASPAIASDGSPEPASPGYLLIEIDGLSEPRLRQALDDGSMPYVASLIESGSHVLSAWRTIGSSTTPVSQAGILHGHSEAVPGYRWWDREQGQLVEASDHADALAIESDAGSGDGLLAENGTSIANVVSGGAGRTMFTVSRLRPARIATDVAALLADPASTVALAIALGDVFATEVRHWLQGESVAIVPAAKRKISLTIVGPALEGLLIDVARVAIIREVALGTPVLYASFGSYDEVAHYAGPDSIVATDTLARIDLAIETIADATIGAPRPYRLVVLSDHGQTPGRSFEQRYGFTLDALLREALGPRPEPIVASSGSLAHVYLGPSHRLDGAQVEEISPGLLARLVEHPGIGIVVTRSQAGHLVARGRHGKHDLTTGRVDGIDPLGMYGPDAADSLRHIGSSEDAGDLIILSVYDPIAGEVAPFERQVSSHGGLGGAQTRALLVYPAVLQRQGPIELVGAEAVHAKLREWMAGDVAAR